MKIISKINNLNFLLFLLIPLFLITGPATPDIVITFSFLYFLILYLFIYKDYDFLKERIVIFSILFWLSLIFISFFSNNKLLSFQDSLIFIRFLFIPILGYFFIFKYKKNIRISIIIIFFTVCFVSIDTLFQFFNYSPEEGFGSDLLGFKSNWYGRLTGPFKDELVPGSFVSKFGLIGFVYFLFQKKNNFNFYTSIIYLSFIGVICFLSGERMALATYSLGLLILVIFLKNYRLVIFSSICLIIITNLTIYKLHPIYNDFKILESSHYHQGLIIEKTFDCAIQKEKKCKKIIELQPRFIEIIKNFNTSAYGEIYGLAIEMFKDNPLTGVGINNYKYTCQNFKIYKEKMKNYNCATHPHNFYIQWLAEGGIIGFALFVAYLINLFIFTIKNNTNKTLRTISLANLVILFWPIMSTGSLIKNWNGVLTFFIIAICISINKIKINNLK